MTSTTTPNGRSWFNPRKLVVSMRRILIGLAFGLLAWAGVYETEIAKLASVMHWKAGDVVADVGAGGGEMSFDAAARVGPTGRVYTTEIDSKKLAQLKDEIAKRHLENVTAVQAAEIETKLPAACCNDIFIRRVYHHFTHPAETDLSLLHALKPGGYLGIIDFPPRKGLEPVQGVPANRGGHGIPKDVLLSELRAAGFQIVQTENGWPEDDYFVLARKPPTTD